MAGRSRGVALSFLYWSRLLELVVLGLRSEREKEIEIVLLRHQLRVLEREGCQNPDSALNRGFDTLQGFGPELEHFRRVVTEGIPNESDLASAAANLALTSQIAEQALQG